MLRYYSFLHTCLSALLATLLCLARIVERARERVQARATRANLASCNVRATNRDILS
jgi:hypothetical protein